MKTRKLPLFFRTSIVIETCIHGKYHAYLATVYTWHYPAKLSLLYDTLLKYIHKKEMWQTWTYAAETEIVPSSHARGLGFYWIEVFRDDISLGIERFDPQKGSLGFGYREWFKRVKNLWKGK